MHRVNPNLKTAARQRSFQREDRNPYLVVIPVHTALQLVERHLQDIGLEQVGPSRDEVLHHRMALLGCQDRWTTGRELSLLLTGLSPGQQILLLLHGMIDLRRARLGKPILLLRHLGLLLRLGGLRSGRLLRLSHPRWPGCELHEFGVELLERLW